jgi:hypothetical protein
MKKGERKTLTVLIISIVLLSLFATTMGIFDNRGNGSYTHQSIRNHDVVIYGKGLYRDMTADVAIQGIAQDYITLFLGIPLLILSFFLSFRNTFRSKFLLAGVLSYFFVTYILYLNMAMFNAMFLVYAALTGTSFFAFAITLISIGTEKLPAVFNGNVPVRLAGGFLIFTASCIALLWLNIIVPPLLDGTIIPAAVQHYTTLTVQGMDLALFLPVAFVSGVLLLKKNRFGYLMATVTLVFLPLLMTALTAKIIAMAGAGVSVIPVIFIIPAIGIVSIVCCLLLFKSIREVEYFEISS